MRTIASITAAQVQVDPTVQRTLDPKRVAAIVAKLNTDALGLPLVSQREDEPQYFVIDGQHRFAALIAADLADYPVEVGLFTGLTIEQEAELFRIHNATKALSSVDKFRISLVEGDKESRAIDAIVIKNGYTTKPGSASSCTAVATLRAIYRRDTGAALDRALVVIAETWGARRYATHEHNLRALANLFTRYGGAIDVGRLVTKMRSDGDSADPELFVGHLRSLGQASGTNPADAGAGKLVTIYNKSYQEKNPNRLPAWR